MFMEELVPLDPDHINPNRELAMILKRDFQRSELVRQIGIARAATFERHISNADTTYIPSDIDIIYPELDIDGRGVEAIGIWLWTSNDQQEAQQVSGILGAIAGYPSESPLAYRLGRDTD